MLIDSHSHLDFVEDLEEILLRAKEAGVSKIVTIGTSIECSKKCIDLAEKYSSSDLEIYATCGIHPEDGKEDIDKFGNDLIAELKKIALSSKKVVGIGECGLDFHLGNDSRPKTGNTEKEFQRKLFSEQIKLATDLDLPLVVHCRNAWDKTFDLMRGLSLGSTQGKSSILEGIFHSWTGNIEEMRKALDLGFYISFSGIVTFKNAADIAEVAKKVQIERILVETDSPFLSPEPFRGVKNEPKNVRITADFIAKLRNLPPELIYDQTARNASKVLGL